MAQQVGDQQPWDFVIVGSGFGGSVSALRLVEKGYTVLLLEKGRRFEASDFPRTNWNLRRWMWRPQLGWRGPFQMSFLPHLTVFSGVGVGGGSLVYANTLPTPSDSFFEADSWRHLADWRSELEPHYATARQMLGVTTCPQRTTADEVMQAVAKDMGREEAFRPTEVGVFFGEAGKTVADPYFEGRGPPRTGCTGCGGCMLGCRVGAKNTLDQNYLYLAEAQGLTLQADTEVTWVRPSDSGGYQVEARQGRRRRTFATRNVVFSGGVLGTMDLLLKLKEAPDGLPQLSERLGEFVRTNSESLIAVVSNRRDVDLSQGVAITSIVHTDPHSHVEPVRYPSGSGFFRTLCMPHVSDETLPGRLLSLVRATARHPWRNLRAWAVPNWAKHTLILLYMRTLEGHLTLTRGRAAATGFRRGMVTKLAAGPRPKAFIPEASEIAERVAEKIGGVAQVLLTEVLMGIPSTAHILGGCCMGADRDSGVIDAQQRLFGYEGLYVADGSAVSANPGVNPSLTITAQTERAMSFIPSKQG
jgi:cholesterol oxidase